MDKSSILYHDIFDYPLSLSDLKKWKSGKQLPISNLQFRIANKDGYYFIKGRGELIAQKLLREKASKRKLEIAKKASRILSFVPTIKMIAVTGSLAMNNSSSKSDIDLMIITKKGRLWTTRLISYLVTWLFGIKTRKAGDKNERNKLCLNIWMDESDLVWKKSVQNIYSSHELGQIIPLVNKENTYEKLLLQNKWILSYWPNSVKIRNPNLEIRNKFRNSNFKNLKIVSDLVLHASNLVAFKMQYLYMKKKISREVATPTRALFHPQDWGKIVLTRLQALD